MGGGESKNCIDNNNCSTFNQKYNLIMSYPMKEYQIISINNCDKILLPNVHEKNLSKNYVDLRNECPPILDVENLPLHPIASVCSILNYQLNKNKLPLFPPSIMFIYHNCKFYVKSVLSFEIIFKAIEKYGFCSEIDFPYLLENLENKPLNNTYNLALPYRFIDIYRIKNDLDLLKIFLQNDKPLLISIVLYNDLINIIDTIFLPDDNLDKRIGAISGILVGYSDTRELFILKMAYGKNFGLSGYINIPYKYIINSDLVPEIYYIDLKKNRIEGALQQNREIISLELKNNNINSKNNNNIFN